MHRGPCRARLRLLGVRGVVDAAAARLRRTWVACCWRRLLLAATEESLAVAVVVGTGVLLLEQAHGCRVLVLGVECPSGKTERLLLRLRLNNGCGVSCRSLGQQHRVRGGLGGDMLLREDTEDKWSYVKVAGEWQDV